MAISDELYQIVEALDFEKISSTLLASGNSASFQHDGVDFKLEKGDRNSITLSIGNNLKFLVRKSKVNANKEYLDISHNTQKVSFTFQNKNPSWIAQKSSTDGKDFKTSDFLSTLEATPIFKLINFLNTQTSPAAARPAPLPAADLASFNVSSTNYNRFSSGLAEIYKKIASKTSNAIPLDAPAKTTLIAKYNAALIPAARDADFYQDSSTGLNFCTTGTPYKIDAIHFIIPEKGVVNFSFTETDQITYQPIGDTNESVAINASNYDALLATVPELQNFEAYSTAINLHNNLGSEAVVKLVQETKGAAIPIKAIDNKDEKDKKYYLYKPNNNLRVAREKDGTLKFFLEDTSKTEHTPQENLVLVKRNDEYYIIIEKSSETSGTKERKEFFLFNNKTGNTNLNNLSITAKITVFQELMKQINLLNSADKTAETRAAAPANTAAAGGAGGDAPPAAPAASAPAPVPAPAATPAPAADTLLKASDFPEIKYKKIGSLESKKRFVYGEKKDNPLFSIYSTSTKNSLSDEQLKALVGQKIVTSLNEALLKASVDDPARGTIKITFSNKDLAAIILISKEFDGLKNLGNSDLAKCLKAVLPEKTTEINENYIRAARYLSKDFQNIVAGEEVHIAEGATEIPRNLGLRIGAKTTENISDVGMRIKGVPNNYVKFLAGGKDSYKGMKTALEALDLEPKRVVYKPHVPGKGSVAATYGSGASATV